MIECFLQSVVDNSTAMLHIYDKAMKSLLTQKIRHNTVLLGVEEIPNPAKGLEISGLGRVFLDQCP